MIDDVAAEENQGVCTLFPIFTIGYTSRPVFLVTLDDLQREHGERLTAAMLNFTDKAQHPCALDDEA
jgi:hypothetical protein